MTAVLNGRKFPQHQENDERNASQYGSKDPRALKLPRENRVVDLQGKRIGLANNVAAKHERQADFPQGSPKCEGEATRDASLYGWQHHKHKGLKFRLAERVPKRQ